MRYFSVLLVLLYALSASAVELVRNGKAAAEIALPKNPLSSVKFAAEELQKHIKLITGVKLPLTVQNAPRRLPNRIHLGYGMMPVSKARHAWRVKAEKKDLYLAGNDVRISKRRSFEDTLVSWTVAGIGTMMAVYDFLDRELKVRWLRPDDSGIFFTPADNIVISPLDRESKPRLDSAVFSYTRTSFAKHWSDRKFGVRHAIESKIWQLRHRMVNCHWFHAGHAFNTYWKRYGKKHPEYFALLHDGTRRPLKGDRNGSRITMCVSSPALQKQIFEDYKKGYGPKGKFKEKDFISICENDTPGMCTCKGCRAWDMPEFDPNAAPYWRDKMVLTNSNRFSGFHVDEGGSYSYEKNSLSDRYARFWLETQKNLRKINPNITLQGYAYLNTVLPPKHVKLNPNILVCYVGTPFYPLTEEKMAETRAQWEGWMKTGCTMEFRPNTTWSGGVYPLQYWRQLAEEYRRILQNPRTKRSHFDSLRGEYANQGIMWYMLARLAYRSDLTVDEIAEEYFSCFGKAAPAIKEYFTFWEKISNTLTPADIKKWEKELGYKIYIWNNWDICVKLFTEKHFADAAKILARAEKAATTQQEKKAVKFFQLGLEHARLSDLTGEAHFKRAQKDTPANQADFKKKHAALMQFRKKHERTWISHMAQANQRERHGYNISRPRKK